LAVLSLQAMIEPVSSACRKRRLDVPLPAHQTAGSSTPGPGT
jgi:hypothetical protein